jgi:hypothetical protein
MDDEPAGKTRKQKTHEKPPYRALFLAAFLHATLLHLLHGTAHHNTHALNLLVPQITQICTVPAYLAAMLCESLLSRFSIFSAN